MDGSDQSESDDDDLIPDESQGPQKVQPDKSNVPKKKMSMKEKEKTLYEIDDVSKNVGSYLTLLQFGTLKDDDPKQCGLYEVSPLEKPSADVIKRLSKEYCDDDPNNDVEVSD